MPLFGRRNRAAANTNAGATEGKGAGATSAGGRFSLAVWLRLHAVDLITMALMGALGIGIYKAPPAPNRSFPVFFQDGDIVYPQFAYPIRKEIVPIPAAAAIAFLAPFFFFCIFQFRRRSMDDFLTTTMGLLKSLVTAAVFQVFLKWLIGGLRPHFLSACQPQVPANGQMTGIGFAALMYDRTVCTGEENEINDSLESFPSGHSTAAFAGLIYLSLYINAQLKVMSAHNPAYWKMILFFAPVLGATLIAGALTIDEFHNWYDVLAGGIIGTCTALVAFRQTFASVWDFRFNHLLLPRTTSLFHRSPLNLPIFGGQQFFNYAPHPHIGSAQLPATREGGWGLSQQESYHGAPFDATSIIGGGGLGGGAGGGAGYGTGVAGRHHHIGGGALGRAEAGEGGLEPNGATTTGAAHV